MLRNDLGEVLQSAYKPCHRRETVIIKAFDEICNCLNDNKVVYMALLDFLAAFDTVDHRILLSVSKRYSMFVTLPSIGLKLISPEGPYHAGYHRSQPNWIALYPRFRISDPVSTPTTPSYLAFSYDF